jgi:uncharacterized protein (DUF433 family)
MIPSTPTMIVPIRMDEHGSVRVGGTRVLLDVLIACYQQGDTPERIHSGFPTVKLADIYAVIGYYLNNQEIIDNYLLQREKEAQALRQKMEAEHPEMFVLQNKLRERLAHREK